jgi:hypothetical protein
VSWVRGAVSSPVLVQESGATTVEPTLTFWNRTGPATTRSVPVWTETGETLVCVPRPGTDALMLTLPCAPLLAPGSALSVRFRAVPIALIGLTVTFLQVPTSPTWVQPLGHPTCAIRLRPDALTVTVAAPTFSAWSW